MQHLVDLAGPFGFEGVGLRFSCLGFVGSRVQGYRVCEVAAKGVCFRCMKYPFHDHLNVLNAPGDGGNLSPSRIPKILPLGSSERLSARPRRVIEVWGILGSARVSPPTVRPVSWVPSYQLLVRRVFL